MQIVAVTRLTFRSITQPLAFSATTMLCKLSCRWARVIQMELILAEMVSEFCGTESSVVSFRNVFRYTFLRFFHNSATPITPGAAQQSSEAERSCSTPRKVSKRQANAVLVRQSSASYTEEVRGRCIPLRFSRTAQLQGKRCVPCRFLDGTERISKGHASQEFATSAERRVVHVDTGVTVSSRPSRTSSAVSTAEGETGRASPGPAIEEKVSEAEES